MNFQDFFSQLNSETSLIFFSFVLIGFLLGVLAGYLLRYAAFQRLQKKEKEAQVELVQAKVEMDQMKHNLNVLERSKEELEEEIGNLQMNPVDKEALLRPLQLELEQTRRELADARAALEGQTGGGPQGSMQSSGGYEPGDAQELEYEPAPEESISHSLQPAGEQQGGQSLEDLSAQIRELQRSNKRINDELEQIRNTGAVVQAPDTSFQPDPDFEVEETLDFPQAVTPPETAPLEEEEEPSERDDLTRIDGIGPFLQQKLYEINITTFQQLASMAPHDLHTLTQKIGYIPGKIEKDDWVGQAKSYLDAEEG